MLLGVNPNVTIVCDFGTFYILCFSFFFLSNFEFSLKCRIGALEVCTHTFIRVVSGVRVQNILFAALRHTVNTFAENYYMRTCTKE